MRYLTKEWYDLCQCTGLHFGMRINNNASIKDEALYLKLYSKKEKEFLKAEHEFYDLNPRFMLETEGTVYIPSDKFINGEDICDEDRVVYHIPPEERIRINKLIDDYDSRPPFDEDVCKNEFKKMQDIILENIINKFPEEISSQVADMRFLALGYCTKEVLSQLKRASRENKKRVEQILSEYAKVQQKQNIPDELRKKFRFHDCKVTEYKSDRDIIIYVDSCENVVKYKIIFHNANIIKQDKNLIGSMWLYDELYSIPKGYEAHILLTGDTLEELTLSCKDITIE